MICVPSLVSTDITLRPSSLIAAMDAGENDSCTLARMTNSSTLLLPLTRIDESRLRGKILHARIDRLARVDDVLGIRGRARVDRPGGEQVRLPRGQAVSAAPGKPTQARALELS